MRKVLITILLIMGGLTLSLCQNLDLMYNDKAFQEGNNFFSVSYGFGNITQVILAKDYKYQSPADNISTKSFGPIFAKYEYAITNKIGIASKF